MNFLDILIYFSPDEHYTVRLATPMLPQHKIRRLIGASGYFVTTWDPTELQSVVIVRDTVFHSAVIRKDIVQIELVDMLVKTENRLGVIGVEPRPGFALRTFNAPAVLECL